MNVQLAVLTANIACGCVRACWLVLTTHFSALGPCTRNTARRQRRRNVSRDFFGRARARSSLRPLLFTRSHTRSAYPRDAVGRVKCREHDSRRTNDDTAMNGEKKKKKTFFHKILRRPTDRKQQTRGCYRLFSAVISTRRSAAAATCARAR